MYRDIWKDLNDSVGRHAQVLSSLKFLNTRTDVASFPLQNNGDTPSHLIVVAHGIHCTASVFLVMNRMLEQDKKCESGGF